MKKTVLTFILCFLFSTQNTFAEILTFDCNYYSSSKNPELKINKRVIDTNKKIFNVILTGHNGKNETYELPISEFIGNASRNNGTAKIVLEGDEPTIMFTWQSIGNDHINADEFTGFFQKKVSNCFLERVPIDINEYRHLFSPYVLNQCKNFNKDGVDLFHDCLARFQQVELNRINRSNERCKAMREKIENSKNYSAGSDAANFLMGMINGYMENEACG